MDRVVYQMNRAYHAPFVTYHPWATYVPFAPCTEYDVTIYHVLLHHDIPRYPTPTEKTDIEVYRPIFAQGNKEFENRLNKMLLVIVLRCQRSFNVSIELDEASCSETGGLARNKLRSGS